MHVCEVDVSRADIARCVWIFCTSTEYCGRQVKSSQVNIFFNDGALNKHFSCFFFYFLH